MSTTTVNIILYKYKALKNNEYPLMIRVTKDRKRHYLSLGVSLHPDHWDFSKNKPKKSCPNKEELEALIIEKSRIINKVILEFKTIDKDFTAEMLIEKVTRSTKKMLVHDFFQELIKQFKEEKRLNYAASHQHLYNSLVRFNKNLNIYFQEIDNKWLKKYESWLRSNDSSENTIGIRFRTLRAVYNRAIEEEIVKPEYYPFKKYKVSKHREPTIKRAITKDDINKVIAFRGNTPYQCLSVDIFTFSYYMGGINFVDIAHLTEKNIIDNQLVYKRKKTKKLIRLPLQPKAIELIEKYRKEDGAYLFPILSTFHETEVQKMNRVRKVIKKINRELREIGRELNIPVNLTTYVARHSFATVLKRSGVNIGIISECLGHSEISTTLIYLDSFENSQIDEAMKNLL